MQRVLTALLILLMTSMSIAIAVDDTFMDYQNYNHGYCPECQCAPCSCEEGCLEGNPDGACSPCDPCAPVCGAECGISLCAIGVAAAAAVVAGVLILTAGNGGSSVHSHN